MANIIITNISKLKENAANRLYSSDCGEIDGINTNDAPVKYLMKLLTDKNQPLTEIIAVTTAEAEPALEVFEKTLSDYAEKTGIKKPEIKPINASEESFAQTIKDITARFASGDKAYIDTTGGFRNSSYILMCVVRILEYSGIRLEKAVYSNLEKKCITDVTDIYRKYDLINAVDAFTNFGNSYGLEQYFKDTQEPAVKAVISAMNKFSDMISLCRTSELSSILEELNESLLQLSTAHSDSTDIILFQSLIGTIRDKFYMKNNIIEYPDIVRWCLDNKLIQQAVTIYVERMPEYFFKKEYYSIPEEIINKIKAANDKSNFDFYYETFYNNLLMYYKSNAFYEFISDVINGTSSVRDREAYAKVFNALQYEGINGVIKNLPEKIFDKAVLENPLKRFLKIRCALYDKKGIIKNDSELKQSFSDNSEIKKIIENRKILLPKTTEGLIKTLANNAKLCLGISGVKQPEYSDTRLNFIESISDKSNSQKFNLTNKLSVKQLQEIFRDIIYAKNFIRNRLNHASDEDNAKGEYQRYFSHYGYITSGDLTVSEIREFMINAIEKLKF